MPNSLKSYKNIEKRNSYRNRSRKGNYSKGWINSHHRRWTSEENFLILNSNKSDRELSKELERSVQSIQIQRSRLHKLKNLFKISNF